MKIQGFLDSLPLFVFLALLIVLMVVLIEVGYWIAQRPKGKTNKSQMAQVRAIMGASLGLLAFMLAFSFSMAQRHFELRTDAYMLEISALSTAYRGADLLEKETQSAAKEKLRKFVALRLEIASLSDDDMSALIDRVRTGERLQDELWSIAESSLDVESDSMNNGIFVNAVLEMIKANDERLQVTLFNRISPVIWITLVLMALLSMFIMGFQAGLTGSRSRCATWTLAFTFSAVMVLVTDLDRPKMSLFEMNQQLMIELQNKMNQTTLMTTEARSELWASSL